MILEVSNLAVKTKLVILFKSAFKEVEASIEKQTGYITLEVHTVGFG